MIVILLSILAYNLNQDTMLLAEYPSDCTFYCSNIGKNVTSFECSPQTFKMYVEEYECELLNNSEYVAL